jgi:hypothetical protein
MGGSVSKTGKIDYNKNDIVSFFLNGREILGFVSRVHCATEGNQCNLSLSKIYVKNESFEYPVDVTDPSLKIIKNLTKAEYDRYKIGVVVSFTQDGIDKEGTIIGIQPSENQDRTLDFEYSRITVELKDGNTTEIRFYTPNLKIIAFTQAYTDKFTKGQHVSFKVDETTYYGKIINKFADLNQDGTINLVRSGLVVEYKEGSQMTVQFDNPGLQIMPNNTGKKKYTLEDENKYRVKYAKYKAKYLAQKNN